MALDQDLIQKAQAAIAAGAPEAEVMRRVQIIQQSRAKKPGLVRTILNPFERAGRQAGGATVELARTIAGEPAAREESSQRILETSRGLTERAKTEADPVARARLLALAQQQSQKGGEVGSDIAANPFLNEANLTKFSDPRQAAIEAAKTTAGIASFAIPGGKLTKPLLSGGAGQVARIAARGGLSAGMFEAGQPGSDVGSTLKSAAAGAVFAPAIPLAGRGISSLRSATQKTAQRTGERATASLLSSTGAKFDDALTKHGVNPVEVAQKQIGGAQQALNKSGVGFEDLVGTTAERGKGGFLGSLMKKAGAEIDQVVKSAGKNFRIDGKKIVAALKQQRKVLKGAVGNAVKVKQLNKLIDEIEKKYANGTTLSKAIRTFRDANSRFGKSIVETGKGAVASSAQKAEANALKQAVKGLFPEITDALRTQEELFITRPMFTRAMSKGASQGIVFPTMSGVRLGLGALVGSALGGVPGGIAGAAGETVVRKVVEQPTVLSRLSQVGISQKNLTDIASKVPGIVPQLSAIFGSQAIQGEPSAAITPEQTQQITGGLTQDNQITNALVESGRLPAEQAEVFPQGVGAAQVAQGGGITPELMLEAKLTLTDKEFEKIQVLDTFMKTGSIEGVGGDIKEETAQRINTAKSGARAVTEIQQLFVDDKGTLIKHLVPGKFLTRDYENLGFRAADAILRLRTGAQANDQEIRAYQKVIMPRFGDSEQVITDKLSRLNKDFADVLGTSGI